MRASNATPLTDNCDSPVDESLEGQLQPWTLGRDKRDKQTELHKWCISTRRCGVRV